MEKINIVEILAKYTGKNISIKQEGFLQAQYEILKMNYQYQGDLLKINSTQNENYLELNLNQIHKIEETENEIKIYMDNDTIVNIIGTQLKQCPN